MEFLHSNASNLTLQIYKTRSFRTLSMLCMGFCIQVDDYTSSISPCVSGKTTRGREGSSVYCRRHCLKLCEQMLYIPRLWLVGYSEKSFFIFFKEKQFIYLNFSIYIDELLIFSAKKMFLAKYLIGITYYGHKFTIFVSKFLCQNSGHAHLTQYHR